MQERKISLVDLLVEILLRWRTFLVWIFCGAILLGGVSYVRTLQEVRREEAQVEEARSQLEAGISEQELVDISERKLETARAKLTEDQQRKVALVFWFEHLLQQQEKSLEQSALMQIDAGKVQRADILFHVTAENQELAYSIEAVYEELLSGGELFTYMQEQMNLTDDCSGLVVIQKNTNTDMKDSFTVEVSHSDEEVCRNMAQAVMEFLTSKYDTVKETLGNHELQVVNLSYASIYDSAIANQQQSLIANLISRQQQIENLKKDFSEEELQYFNILIEIEDGKLNSSDEILQSLQQAAAGGVTEKPRISLKYVFLGILLAVFVYAFLIFVRYVLNTKIRATDELQQIYGIDQLGMIPANKDEKKFFAFIDRRILALRNRNKRRFSQEEALTLTSVAVQMAAERNHIQTIYFCGCDLKEETEYVYQNMKESLEKACVQTVLVNNVLYDAAAMKSLEAAEAVVLVEKAGSTLYTEITQELEIFKREEIRVLGGVLVE